MTTRTEQLRELMKAHGLKSDDVGELLGRSGQTVRIWLCASGERRIPAHMLELLRHKLGTAPLRATVDVAGPRLEIPVSEWGQA